MKHDIKIPIIIPSLYRDHNSTLDKCLHSIHRFYNIKTCIVVLQKYPQNEIEILKTKYPNVEYIIKENGFKGKITEAFQFCHDYMSSKYPYYAFIEDDIIVCLCRGTYYPVLLAYEQLFELNPDCGIIGTKHIGLQFGKPETESDVIKYIGNPAHIIGYNSAATKNIVVDKNLTQFRVDTDITLQIINQGFGLIYLNKLFSYNHLNYISNYKDKKFTIKVNSESSTTNDRSIDIYTQHEVYISNKYSLKINKKGRAMYEHFIKKNNIYLKSKPDVGPIWTHINWSKV